MSFLKRFLGTRTKVPSSSTHSESLRVQAKSPIQDAPPPGIKQTPVTRKQVLDGLKNAINARDEARRTNQRALVDLGIGIREHLLDIALDKSLDHITRRHALRTASKFRDEVLFEFIRSKCLAGKSKGALSRDLGDDEESHSQLGLFIAGEEILNTPDFYERFVSK